MSKRSARIDVTSQQLENLHREVLCNQQLSEVQRRKAVRRIMPLPADGSRVDLYHEGNFVGTV